MPKLPFPIVFIISEVLYRVTGRSPYAFSVFEMFDFFCIDGSICTLNAMSEIKIIKHIVFYLD